MGKIGFSFLSAVAAISLSVTPALADEPTVNFGDDSGNFAKDGECDDMRFDGPGMTDTPLIDGDIFHDATDCRVAFEQGRVHYLGGQRNKPVEDNTPYEDSGVGHIMWGDDSGRFANNGECDDKRFDGPGMTNTPLIDSDIKHDASDCRRAFTQGRVHLRQ